MTKEEILAVLDNPETANLVIDSLKEREYNVITKGENETYLNNLRQTLEQKIAADTTSKIYNNIDNDLFEVAGVKKNPEQKTYEVVKDTLKSLKEGKSLLETKVQDLEKKIAEGSQDKTLVAQIEALKAKHLEYEQERQTLQSTLFQKDVSIEINEALRAFKFKADLPSSLLKTHLGAIKSELISSAKLEAGKYVFHDAQGKVILDDKAQVASAEYILKDKLKDILEQVRVQPGSGSGQEAGGGNVFTRFTSRPSGVDTRGQLIDVMLKAGYIKNSKEYDDDFNKLSEGLRLR